MRCHRILATGSAAVLVAVVPAVAAQASGGSSGGHHRHAGHGGAEVIEMEDDCHPPTFNKIIPGVELCDPNFDGDTTASEFFNEIAEDGEADKWRFHPDDEEIDHGQHLVVKNVGGEFHTFTPVRRFGGGCVPDPRLDIGEAPVAECRNFERHAARTGVLPGQKKTFHQTKHLQRYECLIHPWMRAVIEVDD